MYKIFEIFIYLFGGGGLSLYLKIYSMVITLKFCLYLFSNNCLNIIAFFSQERTKNTQFIIVSLRNIMNELSDHLIGIYKTDNCSKNISLVNASKWKEEDREREA